MNIFILDFDPLLCAQAHYDKHVIKMITEYSQIISTVLKDENKHKLDFYKPTHINHPAVKWTSKSIDNLYWLNALLGYLICEYDFRFGKKNKFIRARKINVLTNDYLLNHKLFLFPSNFAFIMPEEFKGSCPVISYRKYYKNGKNNLMNYTKREIPDWLKIE